jgi:hypothetical protein
MTRDTPRDQPAGALQRAIETGAIVCVATLLAAALRGRADSGSAVAPVNATSHIVFGAEAGRVDLPDVKHTLLGVALNAGASVFWASIHQRLFDRDDRGGIGTSMIGGIAVAALAYLVDYHLVPKRLTPGWEYRVSDRSLAMIFGAMALSLPARRVVQRLAGHGARADRQDELPGRRR